MIKLKVMIILSLLVLPATAMNSKIHKVNSGINIDGIANEIDWQKAQWQLLDQHILGIQPEKEDFSGRFKMLWDEKHLYILAEITDDVLFDRHSDPLKQYWDDDCLEIFIDEDASGGEHQTNFNAFAYHVALDNQVVDIGESNKSDETNFILLNEHLQSQWRRNIEAPHNIIWEVALSVYGDNYQHPNINAIAPVKLKQGKTLGFMLAYCDNDGSETRESFIGSTKIKPVNGDKNLGYKTADVFEKIILSK